MASKTTASHSNKSGFRFDTTYLLLPEHFYTICNPTPVSAPDTVIFNHALAKAMGLTLDELSPTTLTDLLAGNTLPSDATPFAQAYAGHQFGHFTMLGDGRAHVLGEHITPDGERLDIQFKGSGRTPYSRRGDGRASLGPMCREYIMSEAMHALGIPTTRSLGVVSSGEDVFRETAYPGAILTRVAQSHLRVGTFEYAASTQEKTKVEALLHYAIERHCPEKATDDNPALSFLMHVMDQQIDLIVHWMRVGFIHGVMNTDNMAIAGETIDYGPCAFMDAYDPDTVFSSIDQMGRYAYKNQPMIAQWNLVRLAETLLPLIDSNLDHAIEVAKDHLGSFTDTYNQRWTDMMKGKLGLLNHHPDDPKLITDLLSVMHKHSLDYTITFQHLSQASGAPQDLCNQPQFSDWHSRWKARLTMNDSPIDVAREVMNQHNPVVIPRNHHVEHALSEVVAGNDQPMLDLLTVLKTPYKHANLTAHYQDPPPPTDVPYQTFCGT